MDHANGCAGWTEGLRRGAGTTRPDSPACKNPRQSLLRLDIVTANAGYLSPAEQFIGDFHRDKDVDGDHRDLLMTCRAGAGVIIESDCAAGDLDGDHDVDRSDFGILQRCYNGKDQVRRPIAEGESHSGPGKARIPGSRLFEADRRICNRFDSMPPPGLRLNTSGFADTFGL